MPRLLDSALYKYSLANQKFDAEAKNRAEQANIQHAERQKTFHDKLHSDIVCAHAKTTAYRQKIDTAVATTLRRLELGRQADLQLEASLALRRAQLSSRAEKRRAYATTKNIADFVHTLSTAPRRPDQEQTSSLSPMDIVMDRARGRRLAKEAELLATKQDGARNTALLEQTISKASTHLLSTQENLSAKTYDDKLLERLNADEESSEIDLPCSDVDGDADAAAKDPVGTGMHRTLAEELEYLRNRAGLEKEDSPYLEKRLLHVTTKMTVEQEAHTAIIHNRRLDVYDLVSAATELSDALHGLSTSRAECPLTQTILASEIRNAASTIMESFCACKQAPDQAFRNHVAYTAALAATEVAHVVADFQNPPSDSEIYALTQQCVSECLDERALVFTSPDQFQLSDNFQRRRLSQQASQRISPTNPPLLVPSKTEPGTENISSSSALDYVSPIPPRESDEPLSSQRLTFVLTLEHLKTQLQSLPLYTDSREKPPMLAALRIPLATESASAVVDGYQVPLVHLLAYNPAIFPDVSLLRTLKTAVADATGATCLLFPDIAEGYMRYKAEYQKYHDIMGKVMDAEKQLKTRKKDPDGTFSFELSMLDEYAVVPPEDDKMSKLLAAPFKGEQPPDSHILGLVAARANYLLRRRFGLNIMDHPALENYAESLFVTHTLCNPTDVTEAGKPTSGGARPGSKSSTQTPRSSSTKGSRLSAKHEHDTPVPEATTHNTAEKPLLWVNDSASKNCIVILAPCKGASSLGELELAFGFLDKLKPLVYNSMVEDLGVPSLLANPAKGPPQSTVFDMIFYLTSNDTRTIIDESLESAPTKRDPKLKSAISEPLVLAGKSISELASMHLRIAVDGDSEFERIAAVYQGVSSHFSLVTASDNQRAKVHVARCTVEDVVRQVLNAHSCFFTVAQPLLSTGPTILADAEMSSAHIIDACKQVLSSAAPYSTARQLVDLCIAVIDKGLERYRAAAARLLPLLHEKVRTFSLHFVNMRIEHGSLCGTLFADLSDTLQTMIRRFASYVDALGDTLNSAKDHDAFAKLGEFTSEFRDILESETSQWRHLCDQYLHSPGGATETSNSDSQGIPPCLLYDDLDTKYGICRPLGPLLALERQLSSAEDSDMEAFLQVRVESLRSKLQSYLNPVVAKYLLTNADLLGPIDRGEGDPKNLIQKKPPVYTYAETMSYVIFETFRQFILESLVLFDTTFCALTDLASTLSGNNGGVTSTSHDARQTAPNAQAFPNIKREEQGLSTLFDDLHTDISEAISAEHLGYSLCDDSNTIVHPIVALVENVRHNYHVFVESFLAPNGKVFSQVMCTAFAAARSRCSEVVSTQYLRVLNGIRTVCDAFVTSPESTSTALDITEDCMSGSIIERELSLLAGTHAAIMRSTDHHPEDDNAFPEKDVFHSLSFLRFYSPLLAQSNCATNLTVPLDTFVKLLLAKPTAPFVTAFGDGSADLNSAVCFADDVSEDIRRTIDVNAVVDTLLPQACWATWLHPCALMAVSKDMAAYQQAVAAEAAMKTKPKVSEIPSIVPPNDDFVVLPTFFAKTTFPLLTAVELKTFSASVLQTASISLSNLIDSFSHKKRARSETIASSQSQKQVARSTSRPASRATSGARSGHAAHLDEDVNVQDTPVRQRLAFRDTPVYDTIRAFFEDIFTTGPYAQLPDLSKLPGIRANSTLPELNKQCRLALLSLFADIEIDEGSESLLVLRMLLCLAFDHTLELVEEKLLSVVQFDTNPESNIFAYGVDCYAFLCNLCAFCVDNVVDDTMLNTFIVRDYNDVYLNGVSALAARGNIKLASAAAQAIAEQSASAKNKGAPKKK